MFEIEGAERPKVRSRPDSQDSRQSHRPAGHCRNSLIPYHCSFLLDAKFPTLLYGSGSLVIRKSQL
jgi:hypothetical protein